MRTKAEVKRDYEYLMRLWETVRSLTLSSTAPALVYEEGSLIKRSIRDLYNKEIDQILVAGENGYREAKDFMRMLLPSQSKLVQPYREAGPIFGRGGIEAQLDRMLQPHVTLKSGGYIIINQTEALVAIDVNSGRSTREHSVEDTALQTNLEAAEEVARQLRLRDLAGLIVVDFIDMEENRNNRAVEKKMKDCLKDDRARIQVGRISHFGLLEMSRQRIRASVLESTTQVCPTCAGVGHIRSNSSFALHVIRSIEEHLQKQATHDVIVRAPTGIALYVLNEKRKAIDEIERQYGLHILVRADDAHGHQHVAIEQGAEAAPRPIRAEAVSPLTIMPDELDPEPMVEEVDVEADSEPEDEQRSDEGGRRKRRRRRGRRDEADDTAIATVEEDSASVDASNEPLDVPEVAEAVEAGSEDVGSDEHNQGRKRRRRGRRGGGRKNLDDVTGDVEIETEAVSGAEPAVTAVANLTDPEAEEPEAVGEGNTPLSGEDALPDLAAEAVGPVVETQNAVAAGFDEDLTSNETPLPEIPVSEPIAVETAAATEPTLDEPERLELLKPVLTTSGEPDEEGAQPKQKRTGWWARRSFF